MDQLICTSLNMYVYLLNCTLGDSRANILWREHSAMISYRDWSGQFHSKALMLKENPMRALSTNNPINVLFLKPLPSVDG